MAYMNYTPDLKHISYLVKNFTLQMPFFVAFKSSRLCKCEKVMQSFVHTVSVG